MLDQDGKVMNIAQYELKGLNLFLTQFHSIVLDCNGKALNAALLQLGVKLEKGLSVGDKLCLLAVLVKTHTHTHTHTQKKNCGKQRASEQEVKPFTGELGASSSKARMWLTLLGLMDTVLGVKGSPHCRVNVLA